MATKAIGKIASILIQAFLDIEEFNNSKNLVVLPSEEFMAAQQTNEHYLAIYAVVSIKEKNCVLEYIETDKNLIKALNCIKNLFQQNPDVPYCILYDLLTNKYTIEGREK